MIVEIKINKITSNAILPTKGSKEAACWDVHSLEDVTLDTKDVYPIRTGLAFEIPAGYCIDVRPRSGLSSKGVIIKNAPGTIDSDYRGELLILLQMTTNSWYGKYEISRGDRIAQIKLEKVIPIKFVVVNKLGNTDRGDNGFGSTGR